MGTHSKYPGFFATRSGDIASGEAMISFTSEPSHETLSVSIVGVIQITVDYLPVETMINGVLIRTAGQPQQDAGILGEVVFPGRYRTEMSSFAFVGTEVSAWLTGDGHKYLFSIAAGDAGMIGANLNSILDVVNTERANPMGPIDLRSILHRNQH